jgi:hypothetical protein
MASLMCTLCGELIEVGAATCLYCGSPAPMEPGAPPTAPPRPPAVAPSPAGAPPPAPPPTPRPPATPAAPSSVAAGRPAAGQDPFAPTSGPRLTVQAADGRTRVITIDRGRAVVIGSANGPVADLCTDNISRTHAEFRLDARGLTVTDTGSDGQGSTNGTFVNGTRLAAGRSRMVGNGDVVACATDPALIIAVELDE